MNPETRRRGVLRGSFRRDLELTPSPDEPGSFRLQPTRASRLRFRGLAIFGAVAGLVFVTLELTAGRFVLALPALGLALGYIGLLVRAELDSWSIDGQQIVHRRFELLRLRFEEDAVATADIRDVCVAVSRTRARAWFETRNGDELALVEGERAEVERLAERLEELVRFARLEPDGAQRH